MSALDHISAIQREHQPQLEQLADDFSEVLSLDYDETTSGPWSVWIELDALETKREFVASGRTPVEALAEARDQMSAWPNKQPHARQTGEGWQVIERDGCTWWPDPGAQAEIAQSCCPAAAALAIYLQSPDRGCSEWIEEEES